MNDQEGYRRLARDIREARPVIPELDELLRLCGKIRISKSEPSAEYGDHWCVYAHPMQGDQEKKGPGSARDGQEGEVPTDVLIHVHPVDADAQYSAVGVRIMLADTGRGSQILTTGALDADGQTWARGVGEGLYSIVVDERHLSSAEDGSNQSCTASRIRRMAAASANDKDERRTYRHKTMRAIAVLQPSYRDGHAVLTVYADVSLAGRTAVFAIGEQRCQLVLEEKATEAKATHDFHAVQFTALDDCVPQFSIQSE